METTRLLADEHHTIGLLLACLTKLAEEARRSGHLDAEDTARLLHLLETFADGQHQRKEEELLLPLLLERTDRTEEEELGALLADHVAERGQMEELRGTLMDAVRGNPPAIAAFAGAAEQYVALHTEHMEHENQVLLPMIAAHLGPDEDQRLVQAFRQLELGGPDPAGVSESVRALCKHLGIPT